MTLRWRIAASLAAVALVVGVGSAAFSYVGTAAQVGAEVRSSLAASAAAANGPAGRAARGGDGDHRPGDGPGGPSPTATSPAASSPATLGSAGAGCPDQVVLEPATAAQVVAPGGAVTYCLGGTAALPTAPAARSAATGSAVYSTATVGSTSLEVLSVPYAGGGTLQVAQSLTGSGHLLHRLRLQLAAATVAATALAALLGWAIATRLARPITRLRDAAHRIATTLDLSTPLAAGGAGEVGSLSASLATMVGALARSQEQQRRLVADASHEMRTPLTSIRANAELIRRIEELPAAERGEVVDDLLEDLDEMALLLSELSDLSSDLAASEEPEALDLADLARSVAARVQRRTARVVEVREPGGGTAAVGRPRQLERAIGNLVDNAVKYSPGGSPIEVVVASGGVVVLDRGPGVPEGDLPRIFDRFHRAVEARARPGSGLGLSIVLEIVRTHGGEVLARNRHGGGAEIGFRLPGAGAAPR